MRDDLSDIEPELPSNLLVVLPPAEQFQDIEFQIAELIQRAGFQPESASGRSFRSAGQDFFTEIDMSAQNITDGVDDFFRILLFHDVAVSPSPQHPVGVRA